MEFVTVAILIEALIEYGKTVAGSFQTKDYSTFALQLSSILLGIAIGFLFHVNAFSGSYFDINPIAGTLITGIILSRGSNYASDILGKIRN